MGNPIQLPIYLENDSDYYSALKATFDDYNKWLGDFLPSLESIKDNKLEGDVKEIEHIILESLDDYCCGHINKAQKSIEWLINKLYEQDKFDFVVSELDRCYSFRQLSAFPQL